MAFAYMAFVLLAFVLMAFFYQGSSDILWHFKAFDLMAFFLNVLMTF